MRFVIETGTDGTCGIFTPNDREDASGRIAEENRVIQDGTVAEAVVDLHALRVGAREGRRDKPSLCV